MTDSRRMCMLMSMPLKDYTIIRVGDRETWQLNKLLIQKIILTGNERSDGVSTLVTESANASRSNSVDTIDKATLSAL